MIKWFIFTCLSTIAWTKTQENIIKKVDEAGSHYQGYRDFKNSLRKEIRINLGLDLKTETYLLGILPVVTGKLDISTFKGIKYKKYTDSTKLEIRPIMLYNIRKESFQVGASLSYRFP